MKTDEKSMEQYVAEWRGRIIHYMVNIEFLCEVMISGYFCNTKEKQNEFGHAVLGNPIFTLSLKIKSVQFIVKNHFHHIDKFEELISGLLEMIEVRNNFAHKKYFREQNTSENYNFVFSDFSTEKARLKTKEVSVTNEVMLGYIKKCLFIEGKLSEINKIIANNNANSAP